MPIYGRIRLSGPARRTPIALQLSIDYVVGLSFVITQNEDFDGTGFLSPREGCVQLAVSKHRRRQVDANSIILLALTFIYSDCKC